jgi:hypothetical protein
LNVVERAHVDVAAGRAWKGRQRLEGALANQPTDQAILELLGEICFSMGDHPAAGVYWYLTTASGTDVETALVAMRDRFPTERALFGALPMKAPPAAYPPLVRERLERLLEHPDARWLWSKKRHGRPRKGTSPRLGGPDPWWMPLALVFMLAIFGLWLLGAATAVYLVGRAVGALV